MSFTVRIEGADADALQRQAEAEHRSVEELAREVISRHLASRGETDLAADIAAVRSDADFTTRVAALVDRDREILDRLAEVGYLTLAEAMVLAEAVTGIEARTLARASRLGLLDSALHAPAAGFGDDDLHPELVDEAAVLAVRIAKKNHPLPDGNKRLAWACLNLFCELNGRQLRSEVDDAVETMLGVAAGEIDESGLADWLRTRLR